MRSHRGQLNDRRGGNHFLVGYFRIVKQLAFDMSEFPSYLVPFQLYMRLLGVINNLGDRLSEEKKLIVSGLVIF